jgi:4-hydroxy-tetrahydrodipicolinate synthase
LPAIERWSGIITGAVTPFTDDDEIDWNSLDRHLHGLAATNLTGLLVNAMMAEGGHLTAAERKSTLKFAIERVGAKLPLIATIYGSSTSEAAAEAAHAARLGAAALLVFPHPAFGGTPLDPKMPAAYFGAIWNAASLPMIVFRTPTTLGPKFGIEVMMRLCDVPGVAAIKDSAAEIDFYDGEGALFLAADSPLKILIDSDLAIIEFLRMGAHGATSICASVNPHGYVRLFENRGTDTAAVLQENLVRFARAVYAPPFRDFRARLKEALVLDGVFKTSRVRAPLMSLSDDERSRVADALESSRPRDKHLSRRGQ